eukprot:g8844.t1
MRIRVPPAAEPDLSGDDEAATTPEASTDSENDSSFESDEDGDGTSRSGRKSPLRPDRGWPGCGNRAEEKPPQQQQQQQQQQQRQQHVQNPRPRRKVRFTLHDNDQHNRRVSGAMYRKGWGKGRRVAAVRDSALADVGMMRPADLALQQQGAKPASSRAPTLRINKTITAATTTRTITANTKDSGRRERKERIIAAAPFKSTSANVGTAGAGTSASPAAAAASAAARHGTTYSAIPSTPACPKKRKVSVLLSSASPSSPSSSSSLSSPPRGGCTNPPSEAAAAAPMKAAPAAAGPMDSSCEEEEEEELDLTCKEALDLSCEGEIRTPICRFLLPCWPEGVEGYEEAGGWRRLGGTITRENFPRGRRSI